ncbi:MAG: cation diffusion facilitator family transporter [Archaeoglobaceae archaeon]
MKAVIYIYLLAFLVKLFAYLKTGYFAILGDVFHSIADIFLLLILFLAKKYSSKSGDAIHPFGHSMLKNIASLMVAVAFITLIAFELIRESIGRLISPVVSEKYLEAVMYESLVLLLLMISAAITFKKVGVIEKTVFFESFNDALSTVAAIVGVALSYYDPIFDPIAAVIIALLIIINASRLIKSNVRFLLGMSPSDEFYDKVAELCKSFKEVKGVHDMLGVYTGENEIHLDIHVTVEGSMSIFEADKLSERIAEKLQKEYPNIKYVLVHFCPHMGNKRKII